MRDEPTTIRVGGQITLRWMLWISLCVAAFFGLGAGVHAAAGVAASWTCLALGAALGILAPPAHTLPPGKQGPHAPKVYTRPLAVVLAALGGLAGAVLLGLFSLIIVVEWSGDPWTRELSEIRWDWLLAVDGVLGGGAGGVALGGLIALLLGSTLGRRFSIVLLAAWGNALAMAAAVSLVGAKVHLGYAGVGALGLAGLVLGGVAGAALSVWLPGYWRAAARGAGVGGLLSVVLLAVPAYKMLIDPQQHEHFENLLPSAVGLALLMVPVGAVLGAIMDRPRLRRASRAGFG